MSKVPLGSEQPGENSEWVQKEGYGTRLIADAMDLNCVGTEAQMVRFHKGKYAHYHKEKTELFHFTRGKGRVIVDGNERKLTPGTWLLVRPGAHHEFINESDDVLEAIMFKTNSKPDDTHMR